MTTDKRRWEKIRTFEDWLMAYVTMLATGMVPLTNELINFHQSRWGQPISQAEIEAARNNKIVLYDDLMKNLNGMADGGGITYKVYISQLKKRDLTDLIEAWNEAKALWKEAQK